MPHPPVVSVLIVNYNTAALTRRCVSSLRAQRVCQSDGTPIMIDIVVVDNASRPEEREALAAIDARIVYNDENRGYGAALNQAAATTHAEFLLFSNSDTWYFPGAIQTLVDAFRCLPRCGAVGPRLWWDFDRLFLLPPSDPMTLATSLHDVVGRSWSWWQRRQEQRWLQRAVAYWRAPHPLVQPLLSGACLLTHRNVLSVCGGFDEQFHLYYEDTDWCRRVQQHGYRLYYVPGAEVTHLYNQSARQETATAQRIGEDSAARYFRKHYGVGVWNALSWVTTYCRTQVNSRRACEEYRDLGRCAESPQFSFPALAPDGYLWLLSPQPSCIPAIGRFLPSLREMMLPPQVWAQLGEGDFYAHLLLFPKLQLLRKWRWKKTLG